MSIFRAAIVCLALAAEASGQSYTFRHLAGTRGGGGYADGEALAAQFTAPAGIAIDDTGSIYVADSGNYTIRKISAGSVATLAGMSMRWGSRDGRGGNAAFNLPYGVAVGPGRNVYVADTLNGLIRKIDDRGLVTTIGSSYGTIYNIAVDANGNIYTASDEIRKISPAGTVVTLAGVAGERGSSDGAGSEARFNNPFGIAVDSAGDLYVADSGNHTIRKVTRDGHVTTIAGLAGSSGSRDGRGSDARFNEPSGIAVDATGRLFIADLFNSTIRMIDRDGSVTTVAGVAGETGFLDGGGSTARFNLPYALTVDAFGTLYISDMFNHAIRTISSDGTVRTLAGRGAEGGSRDGNSADARFLKPEDVTVDRLGIVYVADTENHTIRAISPDGVVRTIAGMAGSPGSSDGIGSAARFAFPRGIHADLFGRVWVADSGNHTIRTINRNGTVETIAGRAGEAGSADGSGTEARFNNPQGLTVDGSGVVYVADTGNHTIRKITPDGTVTTLAGVAGSAGYVDAPGVVARFNEPHDVALLQHTEMGLMIFVSDSGNHTLRIIYPDGRVTTNPALMRSGSRPPDGFYPVGLAIDPETWEVFIADGARNVLMRITAWGLGEFAGDWKNEGSSDGGAFDARFSAPMGVALDSAGNLYVADARNHAIRAGSPEGDRARIDKYSAPVGSVRQLGASPQSGSAWQWEIVRRPVGSTAQLSSSTSPNPIFIADVPDVFVFRLTATSSTGVTITNVAFNATPLPKQRAVGR